MSTIYGLATPTAIPAEALDLLRSLLTSQWTTERDLENWIRSYPQVLGVQSGDVYSKRRFRLPGEPAQTWEPDILYKRTGEDFFDIIELKKADIPLIRPGKSSAATRWVPSSPPRFTSHLTKAISQLEIYLLYAQEHREFLEQRHGIQLFLPRGLLIAGRETDLTSASELRFLRHQLPKGVELVTWTGVLRDVENAVAHRVLVSIPAVSTGGPFDTGINATVVERFLRWTGFGTPFPDPRKTFEEAEREAWAAAKRKTDVWNIDFDEDRKMILNAEANARGTAYYRAGKYCRTESELSHAMKNIPDVEDYLGPRSFRRGSDRLREGFEDGQGFMAAGAEMTSVETLEYRIKEILETRKNLIEPAWYYRRLMTAGFLEKRLLSNSVVELLKVAGWTEGGTQTNAS